MPYSWLSEALDHTQMVMDIRKQLISSYFITLSTFASTTLPKSHSLGYTGVNALLLGVRGSRPHPDGHGHLETTKIKLFHRTQHLLFQQHYQKVIPLDTLGSMPYSWLSEALDLTQMFMYIRVAPFAEIFSFHH